MKIADEPKHVGSGTASSAQTAQREPIAIVGMACRYPGANDVREFWELLRSERSAIREVPKHRFDIDAFHDPRPATAGRLVTRSGGFLDEVGGFDAEYFRMSPREASRMDPQHRLAMEVSAEAIDDAFLSREELSSHVTGVYMGVWASDWECHEYADRMHTDVYSITGAGRCLISGRVSFAFDLRGPSLTVDTGCSASSIATHLACQSLWLGESTLALAGGVNLVLDPWQGISFSQSGMLSADGQCKAFSARADGLGRSDGCGVVVLMPLSHALARGARIYAVIKGSGVSNDGFSNELLTTPSEIGQELAMQAAYRCAGISPNDLQYVEAHGTGTRAGDPVELRALATVMRDRPADQPCLVGSVKSNIGHTEGAAGIAGLIKTALAIRHRVIPKSLHAEQPTPLVDWDSMKVRVANQTQPWPEGIARAGVSSFGISGTDVHIVLEEVQPARRDEAGDVTVAAGDSAGSEERAELLLVSAMSQSALRESANAYRELLAQPAADSGSLRDICYSASLGRRHHHHRLALVGHTRAELMDALDAYARGEEHPALSADHVRPGLGSPVFVFSGHGPQWAGMGRALFQSEPVFREAFLACDAALQRWTDWSLIRELERVDADAWPIRVIQPSIFSVQVALSALWRSWGVAPQVVVGHSMGEVAAAHVAGILDLDTAARIICRRAENLQAIAGQGGMLAVELPLADAERLAQQHSELVGVAACNSAQASVLSGDLEALAQIAARLRAEEIFCRELKVDAAAHSPQLDPLLADFELALASVRPNTGATIPMCSTVTGDLLDASAFDADYWVRNQRNTVLFGAAIESLVRRGHRTFLEVAPHPILRGAIQQSLGAAGQSGLTVGSLKRGEPERPVLLHSLGQLHAAGQAVDLRALYTEPARFVSLPRYPFQHDQYDALPHRDSGAQQASSAADAETDAGVLGAPICSSLHTRTYLWQVPLSVARSTYLSDHVVQDVPVLPGAAYVSLAQAAAAHVFGSEAFVLEDLSFATALVLSNQATTQLQVALSLEQPGLAHLRFCTAAPADAGSAPRWTLHAQGRARLSAGQQTSADALDREAVIARCEVVQPEAHYRMAQAHQVNYGPAFRGIERLWLGEREALAEVALPAKVAWRKDAFALHPALLDACWQALAGSAFASTPSTTLHLPVEVEHVERSGPPSLRVWAHAQLRTAPDAELVIADVRIFDEHGAPILETRGLKVRRVEAEQPAGDESLYELAWIDRPAPATSSSPDLAGQTWLVLADRTHEVGAELEAMLEANGATCVVAYAASGDGEASPPAGSFDSAALVDPADAQAVRTLVARTAQGPSPLRGVIHLWSLDAVSLPDAASDSLDRAQTLGVMGAAHVVQALDQCGLKGATLALVTAGAQPVVPAEPIAVAQAPLWAFGRVLRYESSDLRTHNVDLGPLSSGRARRTAELTALVSELSGELEDQVALRGDTRRVLQLVRVGSSGAGRSADLAGSDRSDGAQHRVGESANYRLASERLGVLDNLVLRELERTPPAADEVELEVSAAGLNFIDVMKALGIYPGMDEGSVEFGGECVGTIRALGSDVRGFGVGQRVIALSAGTQGCFARFVRTKAALITACPDTLDSPAAATIPCVFLTAEYALNRLGHLAAGERVLIHSAAGGVGLAAIALARQVGAEIHATAGSELKRDFLRGLGVKHVYDSRSTAFAAEIMQATGGEGVDVVLNSLAGEAIPLSLSLLRDDGRFLEIGKRDIYEDMQIGLSSFKRGLSFVHIDIARLVRDKPALMGDMLRELVQRFAQGSLEPLPLATFSMAHASEAFRHMAQAKHIGKVVLSAVPEQEIPASVKPRANEAPLAASDATYLITGGLGGLGLLAANWLATQGARQLVLTGRSAPSPTAERAIDELRSRGVHVRVEACDIGRRSDVARVLERIERELPPLKGVVHAAGVLADGVALELTPERLAEAMWPKLHGAFNLHVETARSALDFFVLFSSAASTLGSPGQGNYAAANEFMDSLAHYRRARGLPALSINWGPWRESGMAARPDRAGRLLARGMGSISDAQGLRLLERLMRSGRVQATALPSADFQTWHSYYPAAAHGLLEGLLAETATSAAVDPAQSASRISILQAPLTDRRGLLDAYLTDTLRRVLRIPADKELDGDLPLNRFGVDSLMAIELKNRLESDLAISCPVTKILLAPSLRSFAGELLELLSAGDVEPAAVSAPTAAVVAAPSALEDALDNVAALEDGEELLPDDYFEDNAAEEA